MNHGNKKPERPCLCPQFDTGGDMSVQQGDNTWSPNDHQRREDMRQRGLTDEERGHKLQMS